MASSQGEVSVSSESVMSVQELMKQPNFAIPKNYIVEPPAISHCHLSLPTIDMNRFASVEEFHLELDKLDSVCKQWGIFQLVNHGVSSELLDKMRYELEAFYNLPLEEKMKYKIRAGEVEGYGNRARSEGKLDWASRLFMLTNPVQRRKPYLFPQLPSSLRETLEAYLLEMQKLGMRLLGLMAGALKIDGKEMEMFGDGVQAIRMSYYPPCPKPEPVIGITPHSDACGITILNQVNGVDGLQIKKDGIWFPVSFLPTALVVNIGDILQILTNGVYHSVEHRAAINSEKERMSIGFFMLPKFEAEIGPSPSLLNPQNPPLYRREGMEQYSTSFMAGKLNGITMLEHMRIEHVEKPNEDLR